MDPTLGERIAADRAFAERFELGELLGAGGMGEVYRCRQTSLRRWVAVKVLAPSLMQDPGFRSRFVEEARIAAGLVHSNVVAVFDHGLAGDLPYLVTEFVEGLTLEERLRKGALPPEEVLWIGNQLLEGVAAIHELGIVHRDLKPANILIRSGTMPCLKIADFGIARREVGREGDPTATGVALGTPAYMAPEQAVGVRPGPASDLYAVGVILFQLLTGTHPFGSRSQLEMIHAHLYTPVCIPESLPPAGIAFLSRALAKLPKDRFPSARSMQADLARLAGTLSGVRPARPADSRSGGSSVPTVASPLEATRAAPRPRRAHLLAVLVALAAVAVAVVAIRSGRVVPVPAASRAPASPAPATPAPATPAPAAPALVVASLAATVAVTAAAEEISSADVIEGLESALGEPQPVQPHLGALGPALTAAGTALRATAPDFAGASAAVTAFTAAREAAGAANNLPEAVYFLQRFFWLATQEEPASIVHELRYCEYYALQHPDWWMGARAVDLLDVLVAEAQLQRGLLEGLPAVRGVRPASAPQWPRATAVLATARDRIRGALHRADPAALRRAILISEILWHHLTVTKGQSWKISGEVLLHAPVDEVLKRCTDPAIAGTVRAGMGAATDFSPDIEVPTPVLIRLAVNLGSIGPRLVTWLEQSKDSQVLGELEGALGGRPEVGGPPLPAPLVTTLARAGKFLAGPEPDLAKASEVLGAYVDARDKDGTSDQIPESFYFLRSAIGFTQQEANYLVHDLRYCEYYMENHVLPWTGDRARELVETFQAELKIDRAGLVDGLPVAPRPSVRPDPRLPRVTAVIDAVRAAVQRRLREAPPADLRRALLISHILLQHGQARSGKSWKETQDVPMEVPVEELLKRCTDAALSQEIRAASGEVSVLSPSTPIPSTAVARLAVRLGAVTPAFVAWVEGR